MGGHTAVDMVDGDSDCSKGVGMDYDVRTVEDGAEQVSFSNPAAHHLGCCRSEQGTKAPCMTCHDMVREHW